MDTVDVKQRERELERESEVVSAIRREIDRVIEGQTHFIERLLVGLLCNDHALIEGMPGPTKAMSIAAVAGAVLANLGRIPLTSDPLHADSVGTLDYRLDTGEFHRKKRPIVASVVRGDKTAGAPATVQRPLREAMQGHCGTIGGGGYIDRTAEKTTSEDAVIHILEGIAVL